MYRILFYFFLLFFVTACSMFGPVKVDEKEYILNTSPSIDHAKTQRHRIIMISRPETKPLFASTQMAYSINKYEINYFSKHRWADTPSNMLHNLMLETLQNTHQFKAVLPPSTLANYQYIIGSELLSFKQVFMGKISIFEIKLLAQIIRANDNKVIATKEFIIHEPAYPCTPHGGVLAANRATNILLRNLTLWSMKILH